MSGTSVLDRFCDAGKIVSIITFGGGGGWRWVKDGGRWEQGKVGDGFEAYFLADKVSGRVVEEGFEDGHERVFVLTEEAEG